MKTLIELAAEYDAAAADDLETRLSVGAEIEKILGDRYVDFDDRYGKATMAHEAGEQPAPPTVIAILREMGVLEPAAPGAFLDGDGPATRAPFASAQPPPDAPAAPASAPAPAPEVTAPPAAAPAAAPPPPPAAPAQPVTLLELAHAFDDTAAEDPARAGLTAKIRALIGDQEADRLFSHYEGQGGVATTAILCEMGYLVLSPASAAMILQAEAERIVERASVAPVDWVDIIRRVQRDLLSAIEQPGVPQAPAAAPQPQEPQPRRAPRDGDGGRAQGLREALYLLGAGLAGREVEGLGHLRGGGAR